MLLKGAWLKPSRRKRREAPGRDAEPTEELQPARRQTRQFTAFALRERDVCEQVQAFHLFDGVCEAIAAAVEVGVVDLADVARQNEFRAFADSARDGFYFVRCQVLGFVNDHELVRDASAADVGEGFEHEFAVSHQLLHALFGAVAVCMTTSVTTAFAGARRAAGAEEVGEVIENGLHPRREFLVFVTREISDVAAQRHDGTGDQKFVVSFFGKDFRHTSRERKQGLARTRAAQQRDHLDVFVK